MIGSMQVLSDSECASWLSTHGYTFRGGNRSKGEEGYVRLPASHYRSVFKMPVSTDARTQLFLSHHLAEWIQSSLDTLLWVTSWASYTSEEMEMFLEFRQGFGEQRQLIDAPGHLFQSGDMDNINHITSILLFMMAFNWEGFVLSSDAQTIIWMADEILETSTKEKGKDFQFISSAKKLGVVKLP